MPDKEKIYIAHCSNTVPAQKIYLLITTGIFIMLLVFPTLLWSTFRLMDKVSGNTETGLIVSLDYDLGENRNKAPFPAEYDVTTYTAQLEAYYNDRVPFRSLIISMHTDYTTVTEDIYKKNIQPFLISLLYPNTENSSGGTTFVENNLADRFGDDTGQDNSNISDTPQDAAADTPSHSFEETARIDATCVENGYIDYTCTTCQEIYREVLPAPGHDYETLQTVEPDYDNYGYSLCVCRLCAKETKMNFTEKLIDTSYFPPNLLNERTVEGRRGWLFYAGNSSISYYRGKILLDDETLADYNKRVATLQALCDEKGIQLQLIIIPNKEQVYAEYMPSYNIDTPYKRVPRLVDYVKENSGVEILYPLDEMQTGKLYWQTYYKYDTHWTHAGAFVGTQCLYQALGLPTTALEDFTYEQTSRDSGDLVTLGALNPENYTNDVFYTPIYKPEVNILETTGQRDGEGVFTAKSDSENKSSLVMIGDSFRLQMLPYLERDFSEITLTHRYHIESEKIVNAVKNADILVLEAAERYDNRLMNDVSTLIEILSAEEQ